MLKLKGRSAEESGTRELGGRVWELRRLCAEKTVPETSDWSWTIAVMIGVDTITQRIRV